MLGWFLVGLISDWLTTGRNYILPVHGILMIFFIIIVQVCQAIEGWAKSTGLMAAVIGLTALLTAHTGLTFFSLQWFWAQELPWWSISLISIFYFGVAAMLVAGILTLARAIHRLHS